MPSVSYHDCKKHRNTIAGCLWLNDVNIQRSVQRPRRFERKGQRRHAIVQRLRLRRRCETMASVPRGVQQHYVESLLSGYERIKWVEFLLSALGCIFLRDTHENESQLSCCGQESRLPALSLLSRNARSQCAYGEGGITKKKTVFLTENLTGS